MAAWTAPKTYVVGETLTAADLNTFQRDNQLFLWDPPQCMVIRGTAQTIESTGSGVEAIEFSSAEQSAAMWTAGLPTRVTITVAGKYVVTAYGFFSDSAGGRRAAHIARNGTDLISDQRPPNAGDGTHFPLAGGPISCAAGDFWEYRLHQNSGTDKSFINARLGVFRTGA